MALTLAPPAGNATAILTSRTYITGDRLEVLIDVVGDASYPTGGYPLTAAQLGLSTELDFINGTVYAAPVATITSVSYDAVNSKLKFLAGGAEVANATNLSTVTVRLVAKGKGFPLGGVY